MSFASCCDANPGRTYCSLKICFVWIEALPRCLGNGSGLPLPLRARVGVRGTVYRESETPHPDRTVDASHHLRDPTSPTRGEAAPSARNRRGKIMNRTLLGSQLLFGELAAFRPTQARKTRWSILIKPLVPRLADGQPRQQIE